MAARESVPPYPPYTMQLPMDIDPDSQAYAAVIPYHSPKAVNAIATSAWGRVYGKEVSQPTGYWEFVRTPQSGPPRRSGRICPNPTYLPPRSNGNSGMNNLSPLHAAFEHRQLPLPSCDHTTCYPPPDVGFLSRRFTENGSWLRARASAVASLGCRRRGSKSFQIPDRLPGDSETNCGLVVQFTPYRSRSWK